MKEDRIYVLDHIDREDVLESILTRKEPDVSFYICDINDLILKFKLWKELFPRVHPHYAVKCNNYEIVIQVLASLGVNFDCASLSEIEQILSLGVDPSRIIFAHTCKANHHIRYAAEKDVKLMTFDSEDELLKIKQNFPGAHAVVRIKHDDYSAKCSLGVKFGCDPFSEAEELIKAASKLGIKVVGVSFHIGFGCRNPAVYYEAIKDAAYVFEVGARYGYKFDLLDIGGGFPGLKDDMLRYFSENINNGLNDYFPDQSLRIIAEPGTYFVKSAFTLACSIQLVKKRTIEHADSNKSVRYSYFINDGVFGSFATIIYNNFEFTPIPYKHALDEPRFYSTVWGPTCNPCDKVHDNILLPKMNIGDWLIFQDTGNYTYVMASKFNGMGEKTIYSIVNSDNMSLLSTHWDSSFCRFAENGLEESNE